MHGCGRFSHSPERWDLFGSPKKKGLSSYNAARDECFYSAQVPSRIPLRRWRETLFQRLKDGVLLLLTQIPSFQCNANLARCRVEPELSGADSE
jgi:hypothetical protein